MRNKILLTIFISITTFVAVAQQIPVGSCGIVNIYDAAGNRTKRTYFCNNGSNPYPQRASLPVTAKTTTAAGGETTAFQEIDALYPNPTSGKFSVTFSNPLDKATIHLLDEGGKVISQVRAKGYKIDFDLSARAAGIYYIRIEENGSIITKKVVKQ